MVKEQFRETDVGRKLSCVQFVAPSAEDIRQAGLVPVLTRELYQDQTQYRTVPYGPLDSRLGISQKGSTCGTCGEDQQNCPGHFGYIDLELPVFHVGFFRLTIQLLQCICKRCSNVLLRDDERIRYLRLITSDALSYQKKKEKHKEVVALCKKHPLCLKCGFKSGVVKKAVGSVLKIVHAEPVVGDDLASLANAFEFNKELLPTVSKTKQRLLNPQQVDDLFKRIPTEDIPLVLFRNGKGHPCDLLVKRVPAPPVCIRPSVVSQLKPGSTEDDITMKLGEICFLNDVIRKHKQEGAKMQQLEEDWDYLQIQCALMVNSEVKIPNEMQSMQSKKFVRSFAQRLKGKQGRFRGNLSGKRVDFTSRTVISPDPSLRIDQVGVPELVAKTLTYPERVTHSNIDQMRAAVINGPDVHPGANFVIDGRTSYKKFLRYGKREEAAKQLRMGDVVERHLIDGDTVLYNRQPSLHKVSIMSHRAKVMPGRTFRFNECVCTPYNADFDGDEMNLHLPQTEEARAEASLLMTVKSNLITPRSGEPLVAAIQDFITAAYLMTKKDQFFPKSEVCRIIAGILDCEDGVLRIELPSPAIIKPIQLWTGKQVFQMILRPNKRDPTLLNLATKGKSYTNGEELCANDGYVLIRNSELLAGTLDKTSLGSGSKTNVFYVLMRDFGEDAAATAMWRLARIAPVFLSNRGFSIGIGDVRPGERLLAAKSNLLSDGYQKCDEFIRQLAQGRLKAQPGSTEVETLESEILRELSVIRDHAGKACLENLSRHNSPLTMAVCGSKGSFINISQMIACVGQQAISGKRPPDGFEKRSLPHFARLEKSPAAKGFVQNSFYSGLTPTEFFFHTMAGREGLVDTAVKTAETGYMQRRLVKCLEDLYAAYDGTVRTSLGEVVQFVFGDDSLDPSCMAAKNGRVIDTQHLFNHIRALNASVTSGPDSATLLRPHDATMFIDSVVKDKLAHCAKPFRDELKDFMLSFVSKATPYMTLRHSCPEHHSLRRKNKTCPNCAGRQIFKQRTIRNTSLTGKETVEFVELCGERYRRAITEPGTALGAIAATSIGEPSTQMTLKTFHFAGVASMNITQGVPRIKEIINAQTTISTPIITAALSNERDEELARRVKARIEKTTLGEISEYIEDVYLPDQLFILVKIAVKRVKLLQLEVSMESIADALTANKSLGIKHQQIKFVGKSMLCVYPPDPASKSVKFASLFAQMQNLKYNLPQVVIKGLPNVRRCVIHADEKTGDTYRLLVEGTDFLQVLCTRGVDATRSRFNNANIVAKTLGIEAARSCIISEIMATMESHGIAIDVRHVTLLADLMTYTGSVLGVTRGGLDKLKSSVLMLASFEKTIDHLYEAAFFGQRDRVCAVSDSIILGLPMHMGTGAFTLIHKVEKGEIGRKQPLMETLQFDPIS